MNKHNIYDQKISEKRAELEKLLEFRNLSASLASQLEDMEKKLDSMNSGAESVSLVLGNWNNVIKSVSLASLGLMKYTESDYDSKMPLPETLVRIRLDKDRVVGKDSDTAQDQLSSDDQI